MIIPYCDTSTLVALYLKEQFSRAARDVVGTRQVPFTQLHALEVATALEHAVVRKRITRNECEIVQARLRQDLAELRLVFLRLNLDDVFADATDLASAHGGKTLARALDLLHVAAAHGASCSRFVSGDDRQLAVAKATGLRCFDIKAPVRGWQ